MYKIGDSVKLKTEITIETGEIISHWAGKIIAIHQADGSRLFEIEFDAPTLRSLSDAYIIDCEDEADPFTYLLLQEDIQPFKRMDTDEDMSNAREETFQRMHKLCPIVEEDELDLGQVDLAPFQQGIEDFVASHNQRKTRATPLSQPSRSHRNLNAYSPNQKVTVKYSNGRIAKNKKFKLVKQDLLNGECVII